MCFVHYFLRYGEQVPWMLTLIGLLVHVVWCDVTIGSVDRTMKQSWID